MSVRDPVHFLLGYVEIEGENGFAERFINCCTAEGIPLWDTRKNGDKIYAKTTAEGFKKIRSPAKKSSMRVRMISKHGIPFFADKWLRKSGLIIGFALAAVILAILSGHIWVIEVDNDTDIPDEKIIQSYEDAGLKIGSNKRVDVKQLRSDVLTSLDDVSWTTVNISGMTATIKVRKVNKIPEMAEQSGISNIIALKDGQVEIIEPYRGSAAVKAGQTVTKGDLLISGVTESRIQSYIFSDADGYVVADTNIKVKNKTDKKITELVPENKKVYYLFILGKEIPLGFNREYDSCYLHKSWMYIGGKKMPFGVYYRVFTTFKENEVITDKNEVVLSAINDYSLRAYNDTLHSQIISENIKLESGNDAVEITGNYFCYENIGDKVPLEVEEIPLENEE